MPGDEIIAFVTRGRGISIHRTDCINIINLEEIERNRLIEANWGDNELKKDNASYRTHVLLECMDRDNLFYDISKILSEEKVSIKSVNSRINAGVVTFNVSIDIRDKEQLNLICTKLKKVKGIYNIDRMKS